MKRKLKSVLSFVIGTAALVTTCFGTAGQTVNAANTYSEVIEFEDANKYEQNGRNYIDSSMFSGYSGSGYLYLVSGWGEVNFTVPQDGEYKLTIATNADSYKENWLYLDDNGAGTLQTSGNSWGTYTVTSYLSAGTHKFGVSTSWGYTALDYVKVESTFAVSDDSSSNTGSSSGSSNTGSSNTGSSSDSSNTGSSNSGSSSSSSSSRYEFESANRYEQNGSNRIDTSFSGYSGNGYLYLVSGWGEVNFDIAEAGTYNITIVTNADSYKENYLYLDDNGAGTLYTSGNKWESHTVSSYLSAGTHKFGVSTSWGYTALDYVIVESASGSSNSGSSSSGNTGSTGGSSSGNTGSTGGSSSTSGMYTDGTKLYTANGNEFVMRGVNIAHAWYTDYTQTSINAVAGLGANCVRVVLADGQQYTKTSASEVSNIISWCKSNGLICILEIHDATGSDSTSDLNNAVNYWIEIKDILNANADYVIVNIANEWYGTWDGAAWASGYKSAIQSLRNAGIKNVLMVDCAGWGQYPDSIKYYGSEVLNADSQGDTMFSIHMYEYAGGDASTVKSNIDNALAVGAPLVIGEFGCQHTNGDVDEYTIMSYCQERGAGYMGWSWKGNGSTWAYLDLSNTWDGSSLTSWGDTLFNSTYGIKNTAKKAY